MVENKHFVKFVRGTQSSWENLQQTPENINNDTLYFIYEDADSSTFGKLYLGQKLICNNINLDNYYDKDIIDSLLSNKQNKVVYSDSIRPPYIADDIYFEVGDIWIYNGYPAVKIYILMQSPSSGLWYRENGDTLYTYMWRSASNSYQYGNHPEEEDMIERENYQPNGSNAPLIRYGIDVAHYSGGEFVSDMYTGASLVPGTFSYLASNTYSYPERKFYYNHWIDLAPQLTTYTKDEVDNLLTKTNKIFKKDFFPPYYFLNTNKEESYNLKVGDIWVYNNSTVKDDGIGHYYTTFIDDNNQSHTFEAPDPLQREFYTQRIFILSSIVYNDSLNKNCYSWKGVDQCVLRFGTGGHTPSEWLLPTSLCNYLQYVPTSPIQRGDFCNWEDSGTISYLCLSNAIPIVEGSNYKYIFSWYKFISYDINKFYTKTEANNLLSNKLDKQSTIPEVQKDANEDIPDITDLAFTDLAPTQLFKCEINNEYKYYMKITNDTYVPIGDIATEEDVNSKESIFNKVTTLSAQSTDEEYPSAKAVYDAIENISLTPGPAGSNGASAYQIAVSNGYQGTEQQWLASLIGAQGPQGIQGATGAQGVQGSTGADGKSAYQIAVDNGFVGTEQQWLTSLVGQTGATGAQGPAGADWVPTQQELNDIAARVINLLPSADEEAY